MSNFDPVISESGTLSIDAQLRACCLFLNLNRVSEVSNRSFVQPCPLAYYRRLKGSAMAV